MKISLYHIECNPTFTSLKVIFHQKVANKYTIMICNYSQTLLSRPHKNKYSEYERIHDKEVKLHKEITVGTSISLAQNP